MDDARTGDRGVERRHDELARELAGDVRREEVNFPIVTELNQRQRRAVFGISVHADEVLRVRPAYRNGREQFLNPRRLDERLVEAENVQIEWVRCCCFLRPAVVRGARLRLKLDSRHVAFLLLG
jgi:hypothetical protein